MQVGDLVRLRCDHRIIGIVTDVTARGHGYIDYIKTNGEPTYSHWRALEKINESR